MIVMLGFDPKIATATAATTPNKPSLRGKAASVKLQSRRRTGGVGMYGLGPKLKIWR